MHWLAGVLVASGFTSLEAVDFYTSVPEGLDRTSVAAAMRDHPGDVYLFSPMTPNLHLAYELAEIVHEVHPGCITVFGGVVATPLYREVAAHPAVDIVARDRGETALPALLNAIETERPLSEVGNLCFQVPGGEIITTPLLPYPDLSKLAFPKVDLFPRSTGENLRYIRQVYALGCPYRCAFCTIPTIGRRPQYFSVERVLAEIEAYRSWYGEHHNVYFGDETFTFNLDRTLELCKALEAAGNVSYDCQTRLDRLDDPRLPSQLARSGCRWIEIGIETGNQASQDRFKQRAKLDPARDTLERLRDAGIAACAFAVNGLPDQTVDEMRRSVDWLAELIADDLLQASYFFGLVPYPGCDLYNRPERHGLTLLHRDLSRYHEELEPVFVGQHGTPDQVYQAFLDGIDTLADAMSKPSVFGDPPVDGEYGNFWASSHV
jgi:radical SAM superfamily enzyme YgiQ (UPF0313 family)